MKSIKLGKHTIFFDEEKHKFTDECGNTVNSVTKFTGVIDKSQPLIFWAVGLMKTFLLTLVDTGTEITAALINDAAKQHQIKKKEAGDIGTAIHDLVSKWIKKEKYEIPEDEKIRNGFNAFLEFQRQHKIKWLASEEIVGYMQGKDILYAGILDAIGIMAKKLVLFDFKSSNSIDYPEYALQCAAYMLAWEQMHRKKIKDRVLIRFGKSDGSFEYRHLVNHDRDKNGFLACVQLKNIIDSITNDRKTDKRSSS